MVILRGALELFYHLPVALRLLHLDNRQPSLRSVAALQDSTYYFSAGQVSALMTCLLLSWITILLTETELLLFYLSHFFTACISPHSIALKRSVKAQRQEYNIRVPEHRVCDFIIEKVIFERSGRYALYCVFPLMPGETRK